MTTAAVNPPRIQASARRTSSRTLLIGSAIGVILLSLLAMLVVQNAYTSILNQVQEIVQVSSAKVDASEAALAAISAINSSASDFVATAADNPKHWASLDAVHASFQTFRDEMYAVRSNLQTEDERATYNKVEYFAFDQFWQHMGNLLTAEQNGDRATAISEYIIADNYLQNQIARYLLDLEKLNFDSMVANGRDARNLAQSVQASVGLIMFTVALALTALAFWLRFKVRRYVTPGEHRDVEAGWVVFLIAFAHFSAVPGQIDRMINDAYLSITASARVLATGNQTASAESAAIIDAGNADYWNRNFDAYRKSVEIRLCGVEGCTLATFLQPGATDQIAPNVINAANSNTANAPLRDGIKPLVANVTFMGEARALEQARVAFADYLKINTQVRTLLQNKLVEDAVDLSTGSAVGQSDEAFVRFQKAMNAERAINRFYFDRTWTEIQAALRPGQTVLAIGGYALVILAVLAGVYQRVREL